MRACLDCSLMYGSVWNAFACRANPLSKAARDKMSALTIPGAGAPAVATFAEAKAPETTAPPCTSAKRRNWK